MNLNCCEKISLVSAGVAIKKRIVRIETGYLRKHFSIFIYMASLWLMHLLWIEEMDLRNLRKNFIT